MQLFLSHALRLREQHPRKLAGTTRLRVVVALAAVTVWGTGIACGQSADIKDLGVGKLLVAARDLADPNFVKSVVLLIQYDHDGTLGLMINHRTEEPVSHVLKDLKAAKDKSDPIYIGGPVELTAVFGLSRSHKKPDGAAEVVNEVYLLPSKPLLEEALTANSSPSTFRLYLGYCGWAGGQLENEVRQGGWWIFEANADLVFDHDSDSVWSRLIVKTEQQIAGLQPVRARGLARLWPVRSLRQVVFDYRRRAGPVEAGSR